MIRELFLEDLSLWNCVWQSTLLAVVGLAGSFLLRHRPARAFQVLFLAMIAAVLVPMMSVIVKHYELGMFTAEPIALNSEMKDLSSAIPYGTSTVSSGADTQIQTREGATDIVIAKSGKENINIPWHMILLFGWLIATLVLLGRLLIAFFNGVCLLKRSKIQACEHIEQAADIARTRLGISKCLLIRSNQEIRSPMIWCWCKNPVLLVPSKLDNNTDWVGVICHELAHWRRLDHISGLIAEIIVCILSWNPLLWRSKKRMVRLGEQACDDWVVAGGRPVESYARSLLDFKPQKQAAFVPAVVHSRKEVATRIRRILKDSCGNPRIGLLWASMVSIIVSCIAVGIAFAQTRPAKTETATKHDSKYTEALIKAAAQGDLEQVKSLISKGADVNAKDKWDDTALYWALWNDDKDMIRLLVTKGANVNFIPKDYWPPLHYVVSSNDKDLAELFIAHGAKLDITDDIGWTAFRYVVSWGNRDLVEFLMSKGADAPAFHLAAWLGDVTRVRRFCDEGTDINAKDELNWTPLHWAASTGQRDVAEFLIANGADVNANSNNNLTPLHQAAKAGAKELVELLLSEGADVNAKTINKNTPLHKVPWQGNQAVTELLIASGADVNAKNKKGHTPLHRAADKGHNKVAELLIAKGADVNMKDNEGLTPLHSAIDKGHNKVAELLIAKGADVNMKDNEGRTSLYYAAWRGQKDAVEFLLTKDADINSKNQDGRTPLDVATMLGDKDMAALLIDKGADINTKNRWGNTPLHIVVDRRVDMDMAALLIAKGADINTKNRWGNTPLHVVVGHRGDKDMAALLIAKGADVNAKNQWDRTPIDIAVDRGHTEIVELLRKHGAKE